MFSGLQIGVSDNRVLYLLLWFRSSGVSVCLSRSWSKSSTSTVKSSGPATEYEKRDGGVGDRLTSHELNGKESGRELRDCLFL